MKLEFRIDWGYQNLYSRRHYHPKFIWDGTLTVDGGQILHTYQLDYPVSWFGPGLTATETELQSPEWKSFTKRGMAGIRFVAEVEEDAVFHLNTVSFNMDIYASDIINEGRIEYKVGPKYLGCYVMVTKRGYLWFRQPLREGEDALYPEDFSLPVHNWMRMDLAWLDAGASTTFKINVPESDKDYSETIFHLLGMIAPNSHPDTREVASSYVPMTLTADTGESVSFTRYYRVHDMEMQILEDDWQRLSLPAGERTITLTNNSNVSYAISRITTKPSCHNHGDVSTPDWMLRDETMRAKVFAVRDGKIDVTVGENTVAVECKFGWNEFEIKAGARGNLTVATDVDSKTVEVYDVTEEADPIKVGYDMTTVPHDDNGYMDWILDYTDRTRLGNYVVFRNFGPEPAPDNLMVKWGEFCRNHGIWVSACNEFLSGTLAKGAGDMFHDCGLHEYPGTVYAYDPDEEHMSSDMKEATRKCQEFLKLEIDKAHTVSKRAAFGDPSGAIRHSFLMGADFVRAETMVGHTQTLLSQCRPAAEALGKGEWGVHIAIQHNSMPYHESHLGQYFLSMMQPWMMGADTIYEEDSLFNLFKEERQAWDDFCTKGKRDMTRSFFKFVKTHPRRGKNVRNIAFLEGRYAAPFNGFICDKEQDPHYSVWGLFGNPAPEWGHKQPEKCRYILDVLMPGASTHPFRQQYDKRRLFFSGTPYGDFDCVPVEANSEYINNYKLLLNLGWNTIINEDYDKLKSFVENGGVLLTGIPQFSTHTDRKFLKDMDDLALMRGGDLSELCGIKVNGRGDIYCGQWCSKDKDSIPVPSLSAMPSDSAEEDDAGYLANVELCGAEIIAWDSYTGNPLLVRKQVGEGYVYTITAWAYPGHEKFQNFSAAWTEYLATEARGDTYVDDETGEVFWTTWKDGDDDILMLLNTDWTTKDNTIYTSIVRNGEYIPVKVKERTAVIVEFNGDSTKISEYTL